MIKPFWIKGILTHFFQKVISESPAEKSQKKTNQKGHYSTFEKKGLRTFFS